MSLYEQIQRLITKVMKERLEEIKTPIAELTDRQPEAPDYHVDHDDIFEYVKEKGPPYEHSKPEIMKHFFGRVLRSRGSEAEQKAYRKLRSQLNKVRRRLEREEGGRWKGFGVGKSGTVGYHKVYRLKPKEENEEKDRGS